MFEFSVKAFPRNRAGKQDGQIKVCTRCKECLEARDTCVGDILRSRSSNRLIVAGPGTGKTFTFKKVINSLPQGSKVLAFTLINNLANDLKTDLAALKNDNVKAATFHGFCREMLHSKAELAGLTNYFEYFVRLPPLIVEDAEFLEQPFRPADFDADFANLKESGAALQFYLKRASYYNAASHNDSVYRVFKAFQGQKDSIPAYDLIIADEYQDFNQLEAAFIDLIGEETNVLIAGDDDQALYAFRHASKEFIRALYSDKRYEKFPLPFCSRCTPVLVEATNYFAEQAIRSGLLQGRIPRTYKCYWPDKHPEHLRYPLIDWVQCSKFQTAMEYVRSRIGELTAQEELTGDERDVQFLIIGPESGYHLKQMKQFLEERVDANRFIIETPPDREELNIAEGYRILIKGQNRNLGWRIILHCDPIPELKNIIRESVKEDKPLEAFLQKAYVEKHVAEMERLKAVEGADAASEDEPVAPEQGGKIRIKLTNFYGCKGLSALHTFVMGLNDRIFPTNPQAISDAEVCKFIVALTRAKRSCSLISNKEFNHVANRMEDRPSTFIKMLPSSRIARKKCSISKGILKVQ